MEPVYRADISVPNSAVSGVYSTLNARRGTIEDKIEKPGTNLIQIRAFIPVLESFDFIGVLRQNTGGRAFPQLAFSHWQVMGNPGDCLRSGTQAYDAMMTVRERKGLKLHAPDFNDFNDKI